MATPKTPFRPRGSRPESGSTTRQKTPPAVGGVVSEDSNDMASQESPQPSPVQPPVPQPRLPLSGRSSRESLCSYREGVVYYDEQEEETGARGGGGDAQSMAESLSSAPMNEEGPPPSPYSPPPASLWSENTQDQWPRNHTKRQFAAATQEYDKEPLLSSRKSTGRASESQTPSPPLQQPPPQQYEPPPPIDELDFTEMMHQNENTSPAFTAANTTRIGTSFRHSHVPPPSQKSTRHERPGTAPRPSMRSSPNAPTTTPPNTYDHDFFLLQEEYKALQAEHAACLEWKSKYKILQHTMLEREELFRQLQEEVIHARADLDDQRETLQRQFVQEINDKTSLYDNLLTEFDTVRQEKEHWQTEWDKLQHSADAQKQEKDQLVTTLSEQKSRLEQDISALQNKLDTYENEIVRMSNKTLELEEALAQAGLESANNLCSVQAESLARGNAWQTEKQALQEEIQTLRHQLVEKDMHTAKLLEDQRREQNCRVQDLERQVHYLTNTLAEWQGRHAELRQTVDQHLQSKTTARIAKTANTSTVACQTETMEIFTAPVDVPAAAPRNPAVRFEEMKSTENKPETDDSMPFLDSNPTQAPSPPHVDCPMIRPNISLPVSEPRVHDTPPAFMAWQSREKGRNRADPPSSFHPEVSRLASPPAISSAQKEENQVVDRVPSIETRRTPPVGRQKHGSLDDSTRRREYMEKVKAEITAAVEEQVHSMMVGQRASTANELMRERMARETLESKMQDLRRELREGRKAQSARPDWSRETSDLLAEIQRECNAAFERGKTRRTSPRTVLLHPIRPSKSRATHHGKNLVQQEDDGANVLQEFLDQENWDMNVSSDNVTNSPLSLPLLDPSLNDDLAATEALVRSVIGDTLHHY